MKHCFFICTFLLINSLGALTYAGESPPLGPIHITGQSPLQTLRLDVVPTQSTVLRKNQLQFSQFNSWTNRWNRSESYLLDLEIIQNIFELSYGMGNDLEIGISVPVLSRFGGKLDGFITKFHNHLGLGQAGRDVFPEDNLLVRYVNNAGETVIILDEASKGTILGDISIFSRWQVYRGSSTVQSVIVSGLLRFPTATVRDFYGSGGTDIALSLSTVYRLSPLFVYTTIGYGHYGSRSLYDINLRSQQWTLFTALELPLSDRFSLIVQEMVNSGATWDASEFAQPTFEFILGAKHRLFDNVLLEYGVMENMFFFNNSNDFGINFGITVLP